MVLGEVAAEEETGLFQQQAFDLKRQGDVLEELAHDCRGSGVPLWPTRVSKHHSSLAGLPPTARERAETMIRDVWRRVLLIG